MQHATASLETCAAFWPLTPTPARSVRTACWLSAVCCSEGANRPSAATHAWRTSTLPLDTHPDMRHMWPPSLCSFTV